MIDVKRKIAPPPPSEKDLRSSPPSDAELDDELRRLQEGEIRRADQERVAEARRLARFD